ncbi:sugar transferase, partial [Candidatus Omnitrophota bacterium]
MHEHLSLMILNFLALPFLLVLSVIPILIGLGLNVAFEWRKDPFFRQERLGYKGKPFTMWKLRTMAQRDDKKSKLLHHKIMRKTIIDELPQIWFNMLRLQMVLIGARGKQDKDFDELELPESLKQEYKRRYCELGEPGGFSEFTAQFGPDFRKKEGGLPSMRWIINVLERSCVRMDHMRRIILFFYGISLVARTFGAMIYRFFTRHILNWFRRRSLKRRKRRAVAQQWVSVVISVGQEFQLMNSIAFGHSLSHVAFCDQETLNLAQRITKYLLSASAVEQHIRIARCTKGSQEMELLAVRELQEPEGFEFVGGIRRVFVDGICDESAQRAHYAQFDNTGVHRGDPGIWLSLVSHYDTVLDEVATRTLEHIPAGARVLSMGEGHGHLAAKIKREGVDIYAGDLDYNATRLTQDRGVPAVVASAYQPPFAKGSFNVVVFNESIGGMQLYPTLENARDELQPDGTLIITIKPPQYKATTVAPKYGFKVAHLTQSIPYALDEILSVLEELGFDSIEYVTIPRRLLPQERYHDFPEGNILYFITARKPKGVLLLGCLFVAMILGGLSASANYFFGPELASNLITLNNPETLEITATALSSFPLFLGITGAGGVGLSNSRIISKAIREQVQRMPAWEILRILDLEKAQWVSSRNGPNSLTVYRIQIPQLTHKDTAPQGLDILAYELFDTAEFELLYNEKGYLIAIYPVLPDEFQIEPGIREPHYFDFSEFYFEIPQFGPQIVGKWDVFVEELKIDKEAIDAYEVSAGVSGKLDRRPRWVPHIYVNLDFRESPPFPYVDAFYTEKFNYLIGRGEIINGAVEEISEAILPVFPTVYHPGSNTYGDWQYILAVNRRLDIQKDHDVLVIGPGNGLDTWFVSHQTDRKIYAVGINPFEVANTRAVAKIAGFELEAKISDNIISEDGTLVFDRKFDRIIWNMPTFCSGISGERRSLEDWHDSDYDGVALKRLTQGLPLLLKPGGQALLWNSAPGDKLKIAEKILNSSGKLDVITEEFPGLHFIFNYETGAKPIPFALYFIRLASVLVIIATVVIYKFSVLGVDLMDTATAALSFVPFLFGTINSADFTIERLKESEYETDAQCTALVEIVEALSQESLSAGDRHAAKEFGNLQELLIDKELRQDIQDFWVARAPDKTIVGFRVILLLRNDEFPVQLAERGISIHEVVTGGGVVVSRFQGAGLGFKLFEQSLVHAMNRNIRYFVAGMTISNIGSKRFLDAACKKLGIAMRFLNFMPGTMFLYSVYVLDFVGTDKAQEAITRLRTQELSRHQIIDERARAMTTFENTSPERKLSEKAIFAQLVLDQPQTRPLDEVIASDDAMQAAQQDVDEQIRTINQKLRMLLRDPGQADNIIQYIYDCLEMLNRWMPSALFRRYYTNDPIVAEHALSHSLDDLSYVLDIIEEDEDIIIEELDFEKLIYATLLHDLSYTIHRWNHYDDSVIWLSAILRKDGRDEENIEAIATLARAHKKDPHPAHDQFSEARLLHDADMLCATLNLGRIYAAWADWSEEISWEQGETINKFYDRTVALEDRLRLLSGDKSAYGKMDGVTNIAMQAWLRRDSQGYLTTGAREIIAREGRSVDDVIQVIENKREHLIAYRYYQLSDADVDKIIAILRELYQRLFEIPPPPTTQSSSTTTRCLLWLLAGSLTVLGLQQSGAGELLGLPLLGGMLGRGNSFGALPRGFRGELERARKILTVYRYLFDREKEGEQILKDVEQGLQGNWSETSPDKLLTEIPTLKNPRHDLFVDSPLKNYALKDIFQYVPGFGRMVTNLIAGPSLAITEGCLKMCSHCLLGTPCGCIRMMPYPIVLRMADLLKKQGVENVRLCFSGDPCDYYDPYYEATIADIVEYCVSIGLKTQVVTRGPIAENPVFMDALRRLAKVDPKMCEVTLSFHFLYPQIVEAALSGMYDTRDLLQEEVDRYKKIITILAPLLAHGSIQAYPTVVRLKGHQIFSIGYTVQLLREMFGNQPWPCSQCKGQKRKPLFVVDQEAGVTHEIEIVCITKKGIDPFGRGYDLLTRLGIEFGPQYNPATRRHMPAFVIETSGSVSICCRFPQAGRLGEFLDPDDLRGDQTSPRYFSTFTNTIRQFRIHAMTMVKFLAHFYPGAEKALDEIARFEGKPSNAPDVLLEEWYAALKDIPVGIYWTIVRDSIPFVKGPYSRRPLPVRAFPETDVVMKPKALRKITPRGSLLRYLPYLVLGCVMVMALNHSGDGNVMQTLVPWIGLGINGHG